MPLINCKVVFSLKWYENCILSSAGTGATFTITDAKLYVPVVTLKTRDNAKLSELFSKEFDRLVYWNKYKAILTDYAANGYIRQRLDGSFQWVNKLFVLPYAHGDNVTNENSYRKYFLSRLKIKIITLKLMEEIFMINQLMTQLSNMMKSEKYQQDKVMIIWLFIRFRLFWKKLQINCS